jgi:hypothetical protein
MAGAHERRRYRVAAGAATRPPVRVTLAAMSSPRAPLLAALAAAVPAITAVAACKGKPAARPATGALTTSAHGLEAAGGAGDAAAPDDPALASSPLARFLAGDRTFGVFSIHDARCAADGWNATAPRLGLANSELLPPSAVLVGTDVTVGGMTGLVVDELAAIFAALAAFGDSDVDGHHVCVVPAAGVGVALSTGNGYIAFEPAAIVQMNEVIPDAERSMYSSTVAFAHELAHQLQFWYGDPFDGDKSVRRTELAADCMGSAFVALTQPSGWIMDEVERGAAGALQAYADLKFRSKLHHGTRVDRGKMAREGVAMVKRAREGGPALGVARLKHGCEAAVRAWDASLPLTPPDQLWGGTEE